MWISAIRPVAPVGTHHTVLMVGPVDAPDGTVECERVGQAIDLRVGRGHAAPGAARRCRGPAKPGDQLLLNLHLFNANEDPLTGTSGIEVIEVDPTAVQHEAGVVLAGKAAGLYVGLGATTQTGTCTTAAGSTLFAVAPHAPARHA